MYLTQRIVIEIKPKFLVIDEFINLFFFFAKKIKRLINVVQFRMYLVLNVLFGKVFFLYIFWAEKLC
jgi:hypothetical protein